MPETPEPSSNASASNAVPTPPSPAVQRSLSRYWRKNVLIMLVLLGIWAGVALGCSILFADALNQFRIGGFPLGFWFAQQGSILVFVLLILVYALLLNRLDARHREELIELRAREGR